MRVTLRILLWAFGLSGVMIALSIFLLGAQATAWSGEGLISALGIYRGARSEPWSTSMDSELRFYAAMFGAYSLVMIWVARALAARLNIVPWLSAAFFVGGVGRAISYAAIGPPHPFFLVLMAFELALPPALVGLWLGLRNAP